MMKNIIKKGIVSLSLFSTLGAYSIEKEGSWWYIYDGSDIVGAYSKVSWSSKYSVGCDSPKLAQGEKIYREIDSYPMSKYYSTKTEAQSIIIKYCKKR